jgi:hypothetical protein
MSGGKIYHDEKELMTQRARCGYDKRVGNREVEKQLDASRGVGPPWVRGWVSKARSGEKNKSFLA